MNRVALLVASATLWTLAAPVAGQSMQGMDHGSMPGMGKPKPVAKPTRPAAKPAARRPTRKPATVSKIRTQNKAAAPPKVAKPAPVRSAKPDATSTTCPPEHAKMGHCNPEPALPEVGPAKAGGHEAMPGMAMDGATPPETGPDPDCPPEHARMGHCTPKPKGPDAAGAATGTDLPPGNAPAPAPPSNWYADRIYPPAEMKISRDVMMKENGGQTVAFMGFNLAEYQVRRGRDGFRWDGEAWYGGDINRLTVKSEGEGAFGEGVEEAEVQLLYSRAIDPYFNLQAGVRQDLGPGPQRTYATVGFEGLAPYWFEVEGALFVSNEGDILARLEGYYDQRITQRLILQPRAELNFALQDVPQSGIGSGLSDVEVGLRLRYEIVKEFAPYVGVEWAKKTGGTARFARAAGEDADVTSFVAGIRFWF